MILGYHISTGGNRTGIGEHWRRIRSAGKKNVCTSIGDYGALQEMLQIDPDAIAVFRQNLSLDGASLDTPLQQNGRYYESAQAYFRRSIATIERTPEWDSRVWWCVFNEPDKNQAVTLAQMAVEMIPQFIRRGIRTMWFGWSSGEPEPNHWQSPEMLEVLRLSAANPGMVAIALHEYSYGDDLNRMYPWLIGRYRQLYSVCDQHGIERVPVLIKEFGWNHTTLPAPDEVVRQLQWLANEQPDYPPATIWYLGPEYGGIANLAQRTIAPVTDWIVGGALPPPPPPPPAGEVDVWRFMTGGLRPGQKGRPYMMRVFGDGPANTERYQNWLSEDGRELTITKNKLFERYRLVGNMIRQVRDTSPDPAVTGGVPHYYEVTHAANGGYMPRFMKEGQIWNEPQPHRVDFFNKQSGALWDAPPSGSASNVTRLRVISATQIETGRPDGELHVWEMGAGRVGWVSQWGQAMRVADDPGPHDNEIEIVAEPVRPILPPVVPPPVIPPPGDSVPDAVGKTAAAVVEAHPSLIGVIPAEARPACLRAILAAGLTPVSSEIAFTLDGRAWTVQAGRADQATMADDVLFLWTAGWPEARRWPDAPVVPPPVPPVPPVLDVPRLNQRDPRWADVVLGQNTGHGKTIGNWGCLLVAYTSQAAYLGLHSADPVAMQALMLARNAMSNQFVNSGALATTFPDRVRYDGFLSRDNPALPQRIRECLAAGMPVPAQVDFNPATAQWEQHWVLLVGEQDGDWLMLDPYHGDVVPVGSRYGIAGDDIITAIFYSMR